MGYFVIYWIGKIETLPLRYWLHNVHLFTIVHILVTAVNVVFEINLSFQLVSVCLADCYLVK